jgi:hypothetical protein
MGDGHFVSFTEKEEVAGGDVGSHPPQTFLETDLREKL